MKQYRLLYDRYDPFTDEDEQVVEEIFCDDIYHAIGVKVALPFGKYISDIRYVVIDENNKNPAYLAQLGYKKINNHLWIKRKDRTFFDEEEY